MDRKSFLSILNSLTHEELNKYIKDNGKKKESESYDCPWYIDLSVNKFNNIQGGNTSCNQ